MHSSTWFAGSIVAGLAFVGSAAVARGDFHHVSGQISASASVISPTQGSQTSSPDPVIYGADYSTHVNAATAQTLPRASIRIEAVRAPQVFTLNVNGEASHNSGVSAAAFFSGGFRDTFTLDATTTLQANATYVSTQAATFSLAIRDEPNGQFVSFDQLPFSKTIILSPGTYSFTFPSGVTGFASTVTGQTSPSFTFASTATYTIVPEPAALATLTLGVAFAATSRHRRRRL